MIIRAPRISKRKQNTLLKCFTLDTTASQAAALAKVSRPCANHYFRHWRERIYLSLDRAPRFEGDVEIDQSFFGGRSKKKDAALVRQLAGLTRKQLIRRTKKITPQNIIEVVGFLQRSGGVYTHLVERSDIDTLLPLIRLVVAPGSKIYTDKWASFNPLSGDGYKHYSLNHGIEYVDRRGRHINGIERFWSFAKTRLVRFHGLSRVTLPLHIKECEFRWNHREDLSVALKAVCI